MTFFERCEYLAVVLLILAAAVLVTNLLFKAIEDEHIVFRMMGYLCSACISVILLGRAADFFLRAYRGTDGKER